MGGIGVTDTPGKAPQLVSVGFPGRLFLCKRSGDLYDRITNATHAESHLPLRELSIKQDAQSEHLAVELASGVNVSRTNHQVVQSEDPGSVALDPRSIGQIFVWRCGEIRAER